MNRIIPFIAVLLLADSHLRAQDSTDADELTPSQHVALYSITGVIVPLAIAGTAISFFPPSGGLVIKDGSPYGSFSIETGYGEGEMHETGEFAEYRLTATYTHIFSSKVRDLYRAEMKKDFHFDFIDRRRIFLTGFHLSAGVVSDFPNHGFSLGGGVWLKSPWLPFFGLFPSHTYGVTYRFNSYFDGKDFHEISLGVTSALTF